MKMLSWVLGKALGGARTYSRIGMLLLIFPLSSCVFRTANSSAQERKVHRLETVTWYWLNSADASEWERDFRRIKAVGIDRVALWYGWDASLMASQAAHTRKALDFCQQIGLDAYLGIWSGTIMHSQKGLNILNPEWQQNWFHPYLQKIRNNYDKHPAVKGYYLDDTLTTEEGPAKSDYGNNRKESFRNWVRILRDTLGIEETKKELVFSDFHTVIDDKLPKFGIDWADIVPFFSRVMVYNVNVSPEGFIQDRLKLLAMKTKDKIPLSWGMFTFVSGEKRDQLKPHPTVEELKRQIQEARDAGVLAVDFYAFRVGDWTVPYEKLTNPLLGPENPSALLRYRTDLQAIIPR